jgi:hypothetical protein
VLRTSLDASHSRPWLEFCILILQVDLARILSLGFWGPLALLADSHESNVACGQLLQVRLLAGAARASGAVEGRYEDSRQGPNRQDNLPRG